ncbi:MAG: response regulator [Terriglobia bacterium]|jgi:response regulator RpfG family c-di-GMP phosphodiesterase
MPASILLIDDEEDVLNGWAKALRPTGHKLLLARTAKAAIEIAVDEPVDIVVVDFILGPDTGVEVLNAIRKKRPLVKSILISAQIDRNLSEESVRGLIKDKVEVDLYLHKPVRNKELREAVAHLLANKEIDWRDWAKKVQEARESKPEDAADAAGRLKQHLKKNG